MGPDSDRKKTSGRGGVRAIGEQLPISASDIETTGVCVQNLHMHTFLVADGLLKFSTARSSRVRARWALGLQSAPSVQMRLWGVGDLLIT
jgi:hypothetical protein